MHCECGEVLTEGLSSYRVSTENYLFILDNIPAYKCSRCKKVLFKDEVVEKIKKLERRITRDALEIISGQASVNLYDYEK